MRAKLLAGLFLFSALFGRTQPVTPWVHLKQLPSRANADTVIRPDKFHAVDIDHAQLSRVLASAPKEAETAMERGLELSLPMPDGSMAGFHVVESPIMEAELAAKFPELKTYRGQGIDDPGASVRFDVTPAGFHAQILSPRGAVYIDPAFRNNRITHVSYYKRDYKRSANGFQCLVGANQVAPAAEPRPMALQRSGSQLRTYRLACAATGEYVQYHGGTVAAGMSAIVTAINRVDGVYESEVAIRMVLIANNNLIVYTNANSDPYSNDNGSTMLGQNQSNIDSVIGSANYDIGHVFSTGGGGVAYLACVCVANNKARGVTGLTAPIGDAFYIDYVAHEMGHQFGGNHTFNSSQSNCGGGNRNASTAFEVGSGSTIMAYAGICGADDLQPHSDPYFHAGSFDEILSYTTASSGNSCAVITTTTNNAPTVSAGANYSIPARTPFTLTATGSDPNGDPLTFCWEEMDLGPSILVTDPDNGTSPLFRSFNPTTSPSRTFPKLSDILNNTNSIGEMLPTTTRTMNFRVTARDNRIGGGGVNTSDMQVNVISAAGPFVVTSPNTAILWSGLQTVTWNVAGTTAAPINVTNVNILLSLDGGLTFPTVLASNVPNSGSRMVALPNVISTTARIKVEGAGNVFFDVSDSNFSITNYTPTPVVVADTAVVVSEGCSPTNNAVDPGETVTVNFGLRNIGTANATNVTAVLLQTGGVSSPSGSQVYGAIQTNGPAVTRPFSFTATGVCGGSVAATFQIFDGATFLGTTTNLITLGASVVTTTSRTNTANIKVPSAGTSGAASPYPAAISVSGVPGAIRKVVVRLNGITHGEADDLDVLLVSPGGQAVVLMSDAGGANAISGVNLTFDDGAITSLPTNTTPTSGTYLPTNIGAGDAFNSPAPTGPYSSSLAAFNGGNPNGNWSLYIMDDNGSDSGNITGGWSLTITTVSNSCCSFNTAPTISGIGNQTINEDTASSAIAFTIGDAESAASALLLSATSSNTNVITTNGLGFGGGGSNRTVTITPAANQSGSSTITVTVSDGQLSASTSFLVTVNAVNDAPVLAPIANRTMIEGTTLIITNTATDIDTPANQLTYSLGSNAPAGALINGTSGVFTWTPSEAQGPSTNSITVIVADNGSPNLTNAKTFTVTVTETNAAPVLAAIVNRTIHAGTTLLVTNSATDSDLPTNTFAFSFIGTPSTGATLTTNGLFSWTPNDTQTGTNLFTIKVTDNGTPPLSDQKSFAVTVIGRPLLGISSTAANVVLTWPSISGTTYALEMKSNLTDAAWNPLTNVVASAANSSITNAFGATTLFYRLRLP